MSSPGVEAQDHLLQALKDDTAVAAIYGARIYDSPPEGVKWPYISLGASDLVPQPFDPECVRLDEEAFTFHLWHEDGGRSWRARDGVYAVKRVLDGLAAELPTHAIATCSVAQSRVFPLPDPLQVKGVVTAVVTIEDHG